MRSVFIFLILLIILPFLFTSCTLEDCLNENEEEDNKIIIGEISVDLNANKSIVRTRECLIGNMVADSIKEYVVLMGKKVDFGIYNGGSIRFDSSNRPDGIYPAGAFTKGMVKEILPFGNKVVVIEVTGNQIKSIFERGAAQLPEAKGPFLHVSSEIQIFIDLTAQPQLLNEEETKIVVPGERIVRIIFNGKEIISTETYKLATNDYISVDVGDGFITFDLIGKEKKETLNHDIIALEFYISRHSPVTPVLQSRIVFQVF